VRLWQPVGVTASAAELHLRRVSEQASPRSDEDDVQVSPPVAAARALVAVGALSSDAALNLLDEHEYERDPIEASASGPAPFERWRVVACDAELEPSFGSLHLRYVIFGSDRTELAVTGRVERAALDVNNSLRVGDDAGTTLTAYFVGGWRAGELRGAFVPIDGALSPATRWLEVDGHRVPLGPDVVPPTARIEALGERDPALRHLWQVITPDDWTDAPAPLDAAVDALVAVGALTPDHPELTTIRDVNAALAGAGVAKRGQPEPWRSLRTRDNGPFDGPEALVVVGAVTPVFDRFGVAIDALESARDGWTLIVRIGPDDTVWASGLSDPLHPPLRWWAADDRGNTYLGLRGSWAGGDVYGEGDIHFDAPLDPTAAFVDLMPTGPEHRAVIRVPLRPV
jgi:hypothetical protein